MRADELTPPKPHGARRTLSELRPVLETPDADVRGVLVVDDEEAIRIAIARYLRSRGFEVETAESADAALGILRQRRFALAICDVRMPGMSGVELVPLAREL